MVGNAEAVRVWVITTSEVPAPGSEVTVKGSAVEVTVSSDELEVDRKSVV